MSTRPEATFAGPVEPTEPTKPVTRKTPPLWRSRDYLLLIGGQGVSAIGSEISLVAFPLLIFALTHSPAQTGLMASIRSLPYALFTLPAGALVDRWNVTDQHTVLVMSDTTSAFQYLATQPLPELSGPSPAAPAPCCARSIACR